MISRLFGFEVVVAPTQEVPKLRLREDCPVSDELRTEFNHWLLQRFGTRHISIVPENTCYVIGNQLILRPEAIGLIKNCTI